MPTTNRRARAHKIPPRYAHQEQTRKFRLKHQRVFDASDAGTGKTRSHIDAFVSTMKDGPMLVIAPKTLLVSAWENDIKQFAPQLRTSVATAKNRAKASAWLARLWHRCS